MLRVIGAVTVTPATRDPGVGCLRTAAEKALEQTGSSQSLGRADCGPGSVAALLEGGEAQLVGKKAEGRARYSPMFPTPSTWQISPSEGTAREEDETSEALLRWCRMDA